MRRNLQPGFTLLELVMVVALIGLLAAFMWPAFGTASRAEHLRESARRLQTLVAMCRAEAMNQARDYRITIRLDGSVRATRQVHPLEAPHLHVPIRAGWAQTVPLLDDVWVEAIQILPEGPPPIQIIDERIEFPEMEIEPVLLDEFDESIKIDFPPDGSCKSLRWVLRDTRGRALLLTLDGRLGRVAVEDWESIPADDVERPEPLPDDEDEELLEYDEEDFE